MDKKLIAERIKKLRKTLNMTQTELATKLETNQAAVSAWELGDRLPGTEFLYKMATEFNVSIDWLLGLSDRMYLNGGVKTYTDLLRLLVAVLSAKDSKNMNSVFELTFDNDNAVLGGVILTVEDIHIRDFLTQWESIYKLYMSHVVDKEIYDLWLEKHYAEMNEPIDMD